MGRVTYISSTGETYEVEAEPGVTIMQLATSQGVPGIVAECGGSMSCATCHVYVAEDKGCDCATENLPLHQFLDTESEALHAVKTCAADCCGESGKLLKKYEQIPG